MRSAPLTSFWVCVLMVFQSIFSSCAPVISRAVLEEVERDLSLRLVLEDVGRHIGKTVLWNGIILEATNTPKGTVLEVLQKPAMSSGKPYDADVSEGRFLAVYNGYLDVAIFSRERKISVAGIIQRTEERPLGEIAYLYPVVEIRDMHLWTKDPPTEIIWVEPIQPYRLRPHHYHNRPPSRRDRPAPRPPAPK